MSQLVIGLAFLFGLIIGSFLNVLISRYGTGESALRGRSRCPNCRRGLTFWELVPLVSYFVLRGRCRSCRRPISVRYPLVELIAGAGTMSIIGLTLPWMSVAALLILFWTATVIFAIDLRTMLIPDRAVLVLVIGTGLFQIGQGTLREPLPLLIGGLVGAGIPLLIILTTRGRGMGWGDAKLGAALGLLLGWPLVIVGLFLAIIVGAAVGSLLVLVRLRTMKAAIPFGPFLLLGAFLAMLWGMAVIRWYFGAWSG